MEHVTIKYMDQDGNDREDIIPKDAAIEIAHRTIGFFQGVAEDVDITEIWVNFNGEISIDTEESIYRGCGEYDTERENYTFDLDRIMFPGREENLENGQTASAQYGRNRINEIKAERVEEARRKSEEEGKKRQAAAKLEQDRRDRAEYERLKEKYGQ